MRSKIKAVFGLVFILLSLSVSTFACTCVRDKIKVKGFTGQIFAVSESNPGYKEKFPGVLVSLSKRNGDKNKLIAFVMADENGKFSLKNIKSGTYILEASAPNFQKIVVEIKIIKGSDQKKDELEIGLEPEVMDCCVGYVKLLK